MKTLFRQASVATALILGLACGAQAADDAVAKEDFSGTSLRFALTKDVFNVTINVKGPEGYSAKKFVKSGAPSLNLAKHGKVADGRYLYALSAALENEFEPVSSKLDNGRGDKARDKSNKPVYQQGAFQVVDGEITPIDDLSEDSRLDQD
ncbi:MAG: hypothetical protein AAF441_23315 [Pseudomonadota bacterium]